MYAVCYDELDSGYCTRCNRKSLRGGPVAPKEAVARTWPWCVKGIGWMWCYYHDKYGLLADDDGDITVVEIDVK